MSGDQGRETASFSGCIGTVGASVHLSRIAGFNSLGQRLNVQTLFIESGSPWEKGYNESFNGKLRDELLNGEIFTTLMEAQVLIERWRKEYNHFRPHSALGYRPSVPEAVIAKAETLT